MERFHTVDDHNYNTRALREQGLDVYDYIHIHSCWRRWCGVSSGCIGTRNARTSTALRFTGATVVPCQAPHLHVGVRYRLNFGALHNGFQEQGLGSRHSYTVKQFGEIVHQRQRVCST